VAKTRNGLAAGARGWLHGYANERFARYRNLRFVRFMGVSAVALATSLILVGLCALWQVDPISAGLISQIGGAIVSYVLSRRAWERKGKPDLLRETIPFWIVFGVATVISTGATKLGYRMAVWMNLHGLRDVLLVESVYLLANIATFLMRFVIFNYVLFADRTKAAKSVAAEADAPAVGAQASGHAGTREPGASDVMAEAASSE
jgi:putative flippase GtrA